MSHTHKGMAGKGCWWCCITFLLLKLPIFHSKNRKWKWSKKIFDWFWFYSCHNYLAIFFGVETHMNMTTKLFRDLKDMAIQRLIGTECRGWKQCQTQDEVQELSCQTQWKSSKVWRWTRQAQILGSVLCLNVVFGSIFPCLSFGASVFHYSVFHYSVFHASVFCASVFRSPTGQKTADVNLPCQTSISLRNLKKRRFEN